MTTNRGYYEEESPNEGDFFPGAHLTEPFNDWLGNVWNPALVSAAITARVYSWTRSGKTPPEASF